MRLDQEALDAAAYALHRDGCDEGDWIPEEAEPSSFHDAEVVLKGLEEAGYAVVKLTPGAKLVVTERRRQIDEEGHSLKKDLLGLGNKADALPRAAACYIIPEELREYDSFWSPDRGWTKAQGPRWWPWSWVSWKPKPDDRVREVVKGAALAVAEVDRLLALAEAKQ